MGVFLAVFLIGGGDCIEARLPRAGFMRAGSVDQVHYTASGMLPAKQPLLNRGYIERPERRAPILCARPGVDNHHTFHRMLLTVRRCLGADGLESSPPCAGI